MTGSMTLSPAKLAFLSKHQLKQLSLAMLLAGTGSQVLGLGLGELSYSTALGQPLDAKIALISPEKDYGVEELKVRQLNAEQAAKMGVELLSYFQYFEITPELKDGQLFIKLRSDDPVTEPFINFFIELKWPEGQVYREYTLLLDPPVIQKAATTSQAATEKLPSNYRQSSQQSSQAARRQSPTSTSLSGDQYRVRSGDSLSRIAQRLSTATNYDRRDVMNWLLVNNPQAFINGDPNRLKAAVVISLPNEATWSTVAAPQPKPLVAQPKPSQSDVRKLTPTPTPKEQAESSAEPMLGVDAAAISTEDRLSLKTSSSVDGDGQLKDLANLKEEQLRERLRNIKEQNDRLIRENKAIEERLNRLKSSDYIKSLERLVQLREQEIAELRAQVQAQSDMGSAPEAATNGGSNITEQEEPSGLVAIDSELGQVAKANTQADIEKQPASSNRLILWALLVVALLGSAYFYFSSRRKSDEVDIDKPGFDEDAELARLDEALASQDQHIGYDSAEGDLNFKSLFDDSGKPTGADHVGRFRPDPELSQKIKSKTQEYVPESPKGFHVVHHHEHDNLDDLISDALAYCAQGFYDKAESMLMAEEAGNGPESRISTALDYVRNLKQQSE